MQIQFRFESYRWFESDAGKETTRTKNSGKKFSFLDKQRAKEARSFDAETPQIRSSRLVFCSQLCHLGGWTASQNNSIASSSSRANTTQLPHRRARSSKNQIWRRWAYLLRSVEPPCVEPVGRPSQWETAAGDQAWSHEAEVVLREAQTEAEDTFRTEELDMMAA